MISFPGHLGGTDYMILYPQSIEDATRIAEVISRAGDVALDIESNHPHIYARDFRVRLVQMAAVVTEPGATSRVVAAVLDAERFASAIRAMLTQRHMWVLHNAPFDLLALERAGFTDGRLWNSYEDTYLLSHLWDPRSKEEGGIGHGLKPVSDVFVSPDSGDTRKELMAEFRRLGLTQSDGWGSIPADNPAYIRYAGMDPVLTVLLRPRLATALVEHGMTSLVAFEHRVQRAVADMQRRGLLLDVFYLNRLSRRYAELEAEAERRAARYGVANVNAPQQVARALTALGARLDETTKTGQPKVDRAVLAAIAAGPDSDSAASLARAIVDAKRARKWRTAYVETMLNLRDANDRVHPSISSLRARTGRMAISDPPLQQLPSRGQGEGLFGAAAVRRGILAERGHVIVSADFDAIEMRLLAAIAGVARMKEAISAGEDLHGYTARLVYGNGYTKRHRTICKGVGFGKVYGGGAETLSRQTGADIEAVRHAIEEYDRVYPEISQYSRKLADTVRGRRIPSFRTPFGRWMPVDERRIYAALNYEIQSTARDIFARALLRLHEAGLGEYLLLPVHDEVLASVPDGMADSIGKEIADTMADEFRGVPITASYDVGLRSWGSLYGAEE